MEVSCDKTKPQLNQGADPAVPTSDRETQVHLVPQQMLTPVPGPFNTCRAESSLPWLVVVDLPRPKLPSVDQLLAGRCRRPLANDSESCRGAFALMTLPDSRGSSSCGHPSAGRSPAGGSERARVGVFKMESVTAGLARRIGQRELPEPGREQADQPRSSSIYGRKQL